MKWSKNKLTHADLAAQKNGDSPKANLGKIFKMGPLLYYTVDPRWNDRILIRKLENAQQLLALSSTIDNKRAKEPMFPKVFKSVMYLTHSVRQL